MDLFLLILFGSFLILMLMGVPLAFSLFMSTFLAMALASDVAPVLAIQQIIKGVDSFPVLAIPVFFLAGDLMNRGQVSEYLIRLCLCLIGWARGALAYFTIIVAMVFAGTTGSSAAESAAIGSVFIPNLIKRGYGRAFSVALVACSSVIGIIVPPSIFMIIYGSFGNVSVSALFIGGVIPGALIGFGLMVISFIWSTKCDYPRERERLASAAEIFAALKKGLWPIGVPVLLIGGMVGGLFTPTEASLVTVLYTLGLTVFFYKTIRLRELPDMLRSTAMGAAIPLFCLATAGAYGYLLAYYNVPDYVGELVVSVTTNPHLIMLFIIATYLVIGTFMDGTPAIIILLPITQKLGEICHFNPLHIGLVVCITMALGLLTPPYGLCTLISCAIGKCPIEQAAKALLPMFAMMLGVVLVIAYFPDLALWLPRLLVPKLVPAMPM